MEVNGIEVPGTVTPRNPNWSSIYVEVFHCDANLDEITAKFYEASPEDVAIPLEGGISLNQIEVTIPTGRHFVSLLFNQPLNQWRDACRAFCQLEGRAWAEATNVEFCLSDGSRYPLADCRFFIVAEEMLPHWPEGVSESLTDESSSLPTSQTLVKLAKSIWKRGGIKREELLTIEPPKLPLEEDKLTRRFHHLFSIMEETFAESWGRPPIRLQPNPDDPKFLEWMDTIDGGFYELAVWQRNKMQVYLAFQQEDRGCPLILAAGCLP